MDARIDVTQNDLALARLTEPQRECLRLVMAGYKSKEIAHALGIGVDAVNKRIAGAKETLGAPSRFAAARQLAAFERQEPAHSLVSQTLAVEAERPVVDPVARSAVEDFHHDEPAQLYHVQEPHSVYGAAAAGPIPEPAQGFALGAGQLVATPLRTFLLCLVVGIILALLTRL
ncbi:MAG: helix-turn-helix domain-containing protein [Sandaracinobacter sp.]